MTSALELEPHEGPDARTERVMQHDPLPLELLERLLVGEQAGSRPRVPGARVVVEPDGPLVAISGTGDALDSHGGAL